MVQDFEYYPLLATVIAVVVLTVVTSFLVASKKLREAWQ
jgi:Flp pilus assembly pilin Flp